MGHNLTVKSKVHPTYKTQYHVGNWPEYEQALVGLGDRCVETGAVGLTGRPEEVLGRIEQDRVDPAVGLQLPLRQTEGFLRSVLAMMRVDLDAPDHTTLSRRGQQLELALGRIPTQGPLHLGVDQSGLIRAQAITESIVDDATTGSHLVERVVGEVASVTADAANDTVAFYKAAGARGATVVVPPAKTASVSRRGPRSGLRDRTITRVEELGRRRWQKESGYHQQAGVENAFFRYKSIIGTGQSSHCAQDHNGETKRV